MTVTPTWLYGADTQTTATNQFGGSGTGVWDSTSTPTAFTFIAGRVSGFALHAVESGAAICYLSRIPTASQHQVGAFWFRVPTAPVTNNSALMFWVDPSAAVMGRIDIGSTGVIRAAAGTGTRQNGPSVADNAWHLLTYHLDTSATTWTMHWTVDDAAQTNATQSGKVATDVFKFRIGTVTTTENLTFDIDDIVMGTTAAEYPYFSVSSNHQVVASVTNADGTHNAGTNIMETQAGTDLGTFGGVASNVLEEWPPTTAEYVRQFAIGASNYGEVLFEDTAGSPAITAVQGTLAAFSASGTAPNDGSTTVFDASNNTLGNIYAGDMTATSISYKQAIIPAPAGGWTADFNGVKVRVGFSTDVTPQPRWTALMLEYLTAVNVTSFTANVTGTGSMSGGTFLRTRSFAANVTGVGSVTANIVVTSSIIIGSKWDTTDQEWNSATDEWDGTLVISGIISGSGTITGTLVRTAATISFSANVTGTGEVSGGVVKLYDVAAAVSGAGDVTGDITVTAPGTGGVTGTGTISGTLLHTAFITGGVTGSGTIVGALGATVVSQLVNKLASYDAVLGLKASFDTVLYKGASKMGVKAPITKADNWFVGEDQTFQFTCITAGAVDNITGWTIEFNLAPAAGETSILTITGTLTSPTTGVFQIQSDAAGTLVLDPDVYYYDVSRIDSGNNQVLAYGPAHLQARAA